MPITPVPTERHDDNPVALTGRSKADPDFVEALMDCVVVDIGTPTDIRRVHEELRTSVLEGRVGRVPDLFKPPRRLLKNGGTTIRADQLVSWQLIADLLLWEAQKKAFSDEAMEALEAGEGIHSVRASFALDGQQNAYLDIHAMEMEADESASTAVDGVTKAIKHNIEQALRLVLADQAIVGEVLHTAQVHARLALDILFRDIIARLEKIRARYENPQDTAKTFRMLESALRLLATRDDGTVDPDFDVNLEQLSVEDAVMYMCEGLYTPERGKDKAKIGIPMSRLGTTQMLTRQRKLEIFAHELAHHISRKKPLAGKPAGGEDPHDGQHEHWEHVLLRRLEAMSFDWETGTASFPSAATPTPPPPMPEVPSTPPPLAPPPPAAPPSPPKSDPPTKGKKGIFQSFIDSLTS